MIRKFLRVINENISARNLGNRGLNTQSVRPMALHDECPQHRKRTAPDIKQISKKTREPSMLTDYLKFAAPKVTVDRRKMLFSGLGPRTKYKEVHEYFSRYGSILQCYFEKDRVTGQWLQNGGVLFSTSEECDKALNDAPHVINDEEVEVKREDNTPNYQSFKFKVCNLHKNTTEEGLQKYYSKWGPLRQCRIHTDDHGHSKCFGFVEFSSQEAVNNAYAAMPHILDGAYVVLRPAKEEDKKPYELRQYRWKNEEKKDYMTNHDDRKYVLRIMGIPPEVQSSDILTDYFYKLGVSVKGCIFMRDDDRKQSSVYGFMALFTTDDVEKIMQSGPHIFHGKKLDFYICD
ncbi:RNA recognition motif domain-containing protein [Ditylenchus destructor]|uniref:RNA recognition motif domain-containing protein n=1 Tax=Ditylenchus destructor TaxID=166010 RepID=A0AAD4NG31_9BILA|nr:RNA recognition motif domain-containing protein [Ditylenchus destructor]